MTTAFISGAEVARRLEAGLRGIVLAQDETAVTVAAERVHEAALFLRDDEELDCKYLNSLTAVDWIEHFEVVYHLSSLAKNHTLVLKARASHSQPVVPTVSSVWLGAHLQEREVFDLMGVVFQGHPAMKRIFLWEGFLGHPLRKDFLALPGGEKPGLQRFPFEFPGADRGYGALQNTDEPLAPSVPQAGDAPVPAEPPAAAPLAEETDQ